MPNVSFQTPTDFTAEADAIARQRKYAELLQAQSQEGLQGQMAGQFYVPPSWTQGLNKAAQGLTAGWSEGQADERQKALAAKMREQGGNDAQSFMAALGGQDARAAIPAPADELGGGPAAPEQAAIAANSPEARQKALAIALQSQSPMLQGAGTSMLAKMLDPKRPIKIGKDDVLIDPNTLKPVYQPAGGGGDYGTTPHYEMVDGKPHAIVYSKGGQRKDLGETTPQNQFNATTGDARMKQEWAHFTFNNLSAEQKAHLTNESLRTGVSIGELMLNGGTVGGGAAIPQTNQPMPQIPQGGVPQSAPQGIPPQGMPPQQVSAPQAAPVAPQQPRAPAVRPAAGQAAPAAPNDGLTPKARFEIAAENAKLNNSNARDATSILNLSKGAEDLLDKAHGSGVGNAIGGAQNFLGINSEKNQADAQLTALSGALVSKQPKMSGPQSDKDVLLYKQMAGDIGNASLPASVRKAALKQVREIAETYKNGYSATGYQPSRGASGSWDGPDRRQGQDNRVTVDY